MRDKVENSNEVGLWRDVDPVAAGKAWDEFARERYAPKPGARNTIFCRYCGATMFVTWRFCGTCDQAREILQLRLAHESDQSGVPFEDLIERERQRHRLYPAPKDIWRDVALHREVTQLQKKGWQILDARGWHVTMSGRKPMEFSFTLLRWVYEYVQSRQLRTWMVYVDMESRVHVVPEGEPIPGGRC